MSEPKDINSRLREAALALKSMRGEVDRVIRERNEPIAIIGMACRFPGGANSPEAYWQLLAEGRDVISEVPANRWDWQQYYSADMDAPGKMYTRWGGFVDQIDQFDAAFFGISRREAERLDPQQRLLLETTWEALERAGLAVDRLAGTRTGVFVGVGPLEYAQRSVSDRPDVDIDAYTAVGAQLGNVAAGRLAYVMGLQGPTVTIDTACSTSIVSMHTACNSLRNGECEMAVVGAVTAILSPKVTIALCRTRALSRTGRCWTFDARADGYVRSEGCGSVVLKRLSDAVAAGDPILGVIRGSAVNHDGRSAGFTAPNLLSQQALMRQALKRAGLTHHDVSYIEAHGTGTSLGDPIEMEALKSVYGERNAVAHVGSVKTNMGHMEAAAGMAGLFKVLLCMQHDTLAPHLHLENLNPNISLKGVPLEIPTVATPWLRGSTPRRAAISSFGLSGTNSHLIVEEPPPRAVAPGAPGAPELIVLSARHPAALKELAKNLQAMQSAHASSLADLSHTSLARRAIHDERVAFVARNHAELLEQVKAFASGQQRLGMSMGTRSDAAAPRLAFVCCGQGPQNFGMGQQLLVSSPVFRGAVERIDAEIKKHATWSLLDLLTQPENKDRLDSTEMAQPALFAIHVGLAEQLAAWGITPDVVMGHSVGEVAAAHLAGVLSLAEAVRLVVLRGQLMNRATGQGKMAQVSMDAQALRQALGAEPTLALAAINAPKLCVVAGDEPALERFLATLAGKNIEVRRLSVNYAFHTPQMQPHAAELVRGLRDLPTQPAGYTLISTVTGAAENGAHFDAAYWGTQITQPVNLAQAVQSALQMGCEHFVELGPHPVLGAAMLETARAAGSPARVFSTLRREVDERAALLGTVAELHTAGRDMDIPKIAPSGQPVPMPTYPWRHESYWIDAVGSSKTRGDAQRPLLLDHAILGERQRSALQNSTCWRYVLDAEQAPYAYLQDHIIRDAIVVPGAGHSAMALLAADVQFGPARWALHDVTFLRVLSLASGAAQVELNVFEEAGDTRFSLASLPEAEGPWVTHAVGKISPPAQNAAPVRALAEPLSAIQQRCNTHMSRASFYQALDPLGYKLGDAFQGVNQLWRRDGECLGEMALRERPAAQSDQYPIYPSFLDACYQLFLTASPQYEEFLRDHELHLPAGMEALRLHKRPSGRMWCHCVFRQFDADRLHWRGDFSLYDDDGALIMEVRGLQWVRLQSEVSPVQAHWVHAVRWQPVPLAAISAPSASSKTAPSGRWLLFNDAHGSAAKLQESLQALGAECVQISAGAAFRKISDTAYEVPPGDSAAFAQLMQALRAAAMAVRGAIYCWGLDMQGPPPRDAATWYGALHLIQALVQAGERDMPRLFFLTRGAQQVGPRADVNAPLQAPLWGLARILAYEHAELRACCIDLQAQQEGIPAGLADFILGDHAEAEVANRDSAWLASRLVQRRADEAPDKQSLVDAQVPWRLQIAELGLLEGVRPMAMQRRAPGPGEVEIAVQASALNFRDIMKALGIYPGVNLARTHVIDECAGVVCAVGPGVTALREGDAVVAIAPGCGGTHVTVETRLVWRKPTAISMQQAAALPVAYGTAAFSLMTVGQMARGDRVLIHSGAGGVGLAAIGLAQRAGAEIMATAGSHDKRETLRKMGIEHVFDSRSMAWVDDVRRVTGGAGVDIILNSLPGQAIDEGMALLRQYGRFLEIGKSDIYSGRDLSLKAFRKNVTLAAIDMEPVFFRKTGQFHTLMQDCMEGIEAKTLPPLHYHAYPMAQATDALRLMAQGKNTGKIVLENGPVQVMPRANTTEIREDASYLVSGGLGGVGLEVADWLVSRGAGSVLLMGRSAPPPATLQRLDRLRGRGAKVTVLQCDVTQEAQLASGLQSALESLPPLRGVFHAAGVLDDGLLAQQDATRFAKVAAPKVTGSWNLHLVTLQQPLDLFVLFSSASSLLGSPGQGIYAASNAFLDGLAHHRRARGLPALSINWGPWSQVGMAVTGGQDKRLASRGLQSLTPREGKLALDWLLTHDMPQAGVFPLEARQWLEYYPKAAASPFFAALPRDGGEAASQKGTSLRALLAEATGAQRRAVMEQHILEQVAFVLRVQPNSIVPGRPLHTQGVDSLMALELRNRLETSTGLALSSTLVWTYPTVSALVLGLAKEMGVSLQADAGAVKIEAATDEQIVAAVAAMSDSDVAHALNDRLASILGEKNAF